jgi:hypothetical protein
MIAHAQVTLVNLRGPSVRTGQVRASYLQPLNFKGISDYL